MTAIDDPRWVEGKSSTLLVTIKHLDGVPWWEAPNPKPRHSCWAQTDGWHNMDHVERCACGAIRMFKGRRPSHWMQKNSNIDPKHTIYSGDYYPPRDKPAKVVRRWWKRGGR